MDTHQIIAPVWIDFFLPNLSESKPDANELTHDPWALQQ